MSSKLNIQQISQISVTVHDLDKASAFYKDVMELKLLFQAPNMALFDCQGIRLLLSIPESPQFDHPSSIIYFKVDDIHNSYQTLVERNVSMMGKPHMIGKMENSEFWMAFFKDPDDNVLAITSEIAITS